MQAEDKHSQDFLHLLAFLVKMEKGSLMDRTPESILAEVEKVDQPDYIDSLDEIEKKRYNIYIAFHKINGKDEDMGRRQLKRKDTKMSDEQETTAAAENVAEATPAEQTPEAAASSDSSAAPAEGSEQNS